MENNSKVNKHGVRRPRRDERKAVDEEQLDHNMVAYWEPLRSFVEQHPSGDEPECNRSDDKKRHGEDFGRLPSTGNYKCVQQPWNLPAKHRRPNPPSPICGSDGIELVFFIANEWNGMVEKYFHRRLVMVFTEQGSTCFIKTDQNVIVLKFTSQNEKNGISLARLFHEDNERPPSPELRSS
ncbi:hypothetical protein AC249_AIPGENE2271 [Exaiptasia diaphana]|nr:hypothetical protein AC249_AIPGENE2271 [Exaiptasia diaphana]